MPDASERTEQYAADMRDKAMAARQAVSDLITEARRLAAESLGDLHESTRGWVDDTTQFAVDKAKGVDETIVDYVKENPYRTLAIAIGAGVLIGFLMRGSRS